MKLSMKFTTVKFNLFLLLGTLAAMVIMPPHPAHATITITPMFVVIEGRQRYADFNLINTSDEEQTYDIGWRYFKMADGTGEYLITDKPPTDFNIADNIVFTPRKVTLAPRETQKVRLALRLKGEPPAPGDYRAHLEFSQVKQEEPTPPPPEQNSSDPEKNAVKVSVGVNVAYSVPVIYRVGDADANAIMGDITTSVNPNSGAIEVNVPITRQGATSLMANLTVYHTPPGGKKTMVGEIQNANIFSEATQRTFVTQLILKALPSGSLEVVYKEADPKKNVVFAQRTLTITP